MLIASTPIKMRIIMQQYSLISTSVLLLSIIFTTTTALAQLSPIQPPTSSPSPPSPPLPQPTPTPPLSQPSPPSPAAAAPSPGLNTVPLVPVTPSGAPTPTTTIPKGPTIDIIQILRKAKRFSVLIRLLKTTQLLNQLNSQLVASSGSGGLTLFAPEDSAFSKLKAGFLNSLGDRQKVELLQFHTLSSFISISNFDTLTNPVQTQAGDDPKRLQLNVTTYGGSQVSMATGAVNATVTGTVYSDNKLAIYQVDKVLLPLDLVLPAKAPAPAPELAKKGLPKGGKTNSSAVEDAGAGGDDGDGDGKDLPAGISAAAGSVTWMWVNVVVVVGGVGLVGGGAFV